MTQTDFLRRTSMVSKGHLRSSDSARGQPSVLQLLPFSNNDAAEDTGHSGSSDVTEPSVSETRVFPVLAVTRSHPSPETVSSASDGTCHDSDHKYSTNSQKRLPRATSERLSRDQTIPRIRAKSEYNARLESKPSTATIYSNDGIDPITMGHDLEDSGNSRLDLPPSLKSDPVSKKSPTKSRYAQKPLLKLSDVNKKSYLMAFWYKKEMSSAEMKTKKTNWDQSRTSGNLPSKSGVKLNIKELPRSKTPIVDNDPDRLNMNHVIAFLQSKDVDVRSDKKKDPQNEKVVKKTTAYDLDFDQLNRPTLYQRQQTIIVESRAQAEVIDTNVNKQLKNDTDRTNHRFPDFRPKSYPSYQIDRLKKNSVDKKLEDVARRTKNLKYSDIKTYNAVIASQSEPRKRPKSLRWRVSSDQQEAINVSTMVRKINDTARPFRLHRFLTIVPDKVPDMETEVSGSSENRRNETATERLTVSQRNRVTIKSHTDGISKTENSHNESRDIKVHVSLAKKRLKKESSSLTATVLSLAVKKVAHFSDANPDRQGEESGGKKKTAVIRLPSADYDSDDEPLPAAAPFREVTRSSYREPTQTPLQHGNIDFRPKSSFIFANEINDNNSSLNIETTSSVYFPDDPPQSGNGEKALFSKPQNESKLDRLDNIISKPNVDRVLANDVSLPSSLFLNYPAPGLSLYTSSGTWLSSRDSPDDNQKQNGRLFPSHENRISSLRSSSLQTFPRSQVKLSLRKERDRTSALTYMSDMETLQFTTQD